MTVDEFKAVLLWSVAINYGVLMVWFLAIVFARDYLFQIQTRWFKISRETFEVLNYAGFAIYKIGVFLLNLSPLVALHMVF